MKRDAILTCDQKPTRSVAVCNAGNWTYLLHTARPDAMKLFAGCYITEYLHVSLDIHAGNVDV